MIENYIKNGSDKLEVVIIGGLGDCILMVPYVYELSRTGRYSQISCLAIPGAKEIFDTNPHVTSFRSIEHVQEQLMTIYHAKDYDCLHNLGLARKASVANRYCMDLYEEYFCYSPETRIPQIHTELEDEAWAQQLADKVARPFALITADAGWVDKCYSDSQWQQVVNHISKSHAVLEIGRTSSGIDCTEFLQPLPSLRKTAALAKKADVIICPDTYLGHMALAVNTRAIVLFGATSGEVWGHRENINLSTDVCKPCTQIDDQFRTRKECKDNICISSIKPSTIIEAFGAIATRDRQGPQLH